MTASLFVFLYPLVVIISIVGYFPQIKNLIWTDTKPVNISIHSWYIWCLSGFLTLGYAVFHLKDLMFTLTSAVSFLLIVATTALIHYNLYYRFENRPQENSKENELRLKARTAQR